MSVGHYTYRVSWSAEDDEHVGLCAEFPSLSWLSKTPEAALKGIRRVVSEAVSDMQTAGEAIPVPLAEKHYSGEFRVRIPPLSQPLSREGREEPDNFPLPSREMPAAKRD